ncbi:MAG: hypothetical protein GXZ04_01095 [Clostridiales bacterium]|nr:hypothetical protein [Clostridiales bacterium]
MPSGLGNYLAIALSSMAVYLFLLIAIRLLGRNELQRPVRIDVFYS